ncbi:MAG: hypothetical protein DIU80_020155 [Chloroflexota bacterium]
MRVEPFRSLNMKVGVRTPTPRPGAGTSGEKSWRNSASAVTSAALAAWALERGVERDRGAQMRVYIAIGGLPVRRVAHRLQARDRRAMIGGDVAAPPTPFPGM